MAKYVDVLQEKGWQNFFIHLVIQQLNTKRTDVYWEAVTVLEFGEQTKQGPVPFTVGGTDDNAGTEEEANPGMRHPEEVAGIFLADSWRMSAN